MKNLNCFLAPSLKCGVYFTLTAHINLDQPHFKGSIATCGQWLLFWTLRLDSWTLHYTVWNWDVLGLPIPRSCLSVPHSFLHTAFIECPPCACGFLRRNQKRNGVCGGQVSCVTGQWTIHLWGPGICYSLGVSSWGLPPMCGWQMLWIWPFIFSSVS